MSDFKIAWMFPDTLCLHGERGNILALKRFAKLAGFNPAVDKIDFDTKHFEPMEYQVIFFAPGEISSFGEVLGWLGKYADKLRGYIGSGRVLIATGTSAALFGDKIIRTDGEELQGLSVLNTAYKENEYIYGDDIYFSACYNSKEMELIGTQIQAGDLLTGQEKPFGRLLYGYGNTGKDTNEGATLVNSFFTNALGPLLICNPWLTKEVIKAAAAASELNADTEALDEFDDSLERKSFEAKKRFIMSKETELGNCPRQ